MTYVSAIKAPKSAFAGRLAALRADFGKRWANHRLYRQTLTELRSMSDRDLADIGLHPLQLEDVAAEAVYGKNA